MAKPLSVHELADLRNWTLAALEDDPEDDFPRLVLQLLNENTELRSLLLRAKESGQLAVVDQLSTECDALRGELAETYRELARLQRGASE